MPATTAADPSRKAISSAPVERRPAAAGRQPGAALRQRHRRRGDGLLRARASERRILGAVRSVRDSRLPLLADLEIFSLCMRAQHWEALD